MNPEQQRIAIAEACGWTPSKIDKCWNNAKRMETLEELPDYLNDLNAMHEAEKVLINGKEQVYFEDLHGVAGNLTFYCATAAQRAEAFLKTLNLWKL